MKKLFLSINLILCGLLAFSQPSSIKNLNTAKITFETEIIDYGTIEQGSDGVRDFVFTNTGNSPLIISEAKKLVDVLFQAGQKSQLNLVKVPLLK